MARWLAAVLAVSVLTGCSVVEAPPAGLTEAQKDELRHHRLDGLWAETGLYPDQRPAAPSLTVVSAGDYSFAYVKCMNNAGFDEYSAQTVGDAVAMTMPDEPKSTEEKVARYLCAASFEVEGRFDSVFNDDQLDYVYDYYSQQLVPCLGLEGFAVEQPPTRNEFHSSYGAWHPYYALSIEKSAELVEHPELEWECPPLPPGMADPGFALIWQQQF